MTEQERLLERKEDDARFTASLAGLAVALFLAVVGLYLLNALAAESNMEDCLLQGRMDCAPIAPDSTD